VTDFNDDAVEDAYDADDAPTERIAVLWRWLGHLKLAQKKDHPALQRALGAVEQDMADPRMQPVLPELDDVHAALVKLLGGA